MVVGRIAGHPTGGRKPPIQGKKAAPYEPKARQPGKIQTQNNRAAQRSRSRLSDLTPEEVQTIIDLDETKEDLEQQMKKVLEERDEMKSRHRNDLDEGKRLIRCGKSNDLELQAVVDEKDRCVEQLNIAILGQVADDRHSWEELLEDPEISNRQSAIEKSLLEAEKLYEEQKVNTNIKVAAFTKAKTDYELATTTLHNYENDIKVAESSMVELLANRNRITAERDELRKVYDAARRGEQEALSRKAEKDGEKQIADQQRERMLERVNKLSNNIKGFACINASPETLENLSIAVKGLDKKLLEVKHLKFEFDKIVSNLREIPAQENKRNSAVIIIGTSVEDTAKTVGEWISTITDIKTVKAVEVYNDQSRDILLENDQKQEELISSGGSQELDFGQLTETSELKTDLVSKNLSLRSKRGFVTGRQSVAFFASTLSKNIQFYCVSPASKEDTLHLVATLSKLSSEPKEARSMLKRSMLGRQIHSAISEGTSLSIIVNVDQSTQQNSLIDSCRFIHRCMQTDLGVK
eukprot:TRINITY_DN20456_c0_g1_i1.p1 TRINITY_DN20456_c0_g1~~TRINITY_DN20456_c0_g1_i1.p1  ORF type:complete len:531 (+),score=129.27 TRINITY_DN20456_c0_g1_i1:25-1593(+)